MYTVDRNGDLVGYSPWPWDQFYWPLVGCFVDGRLTSVAACDLPKPTAAFEGPDRRCWFRMPVEAGLARRIQAGRSGVVLARLEDGERLAHAQAPEHDPKTRSVEELIQLGRGPVVTLDGFPRFLTLPPRYQLEVLFLDVLRRWPDPQAFKAYVDPLLVRSTHILEVRAALVESDEFKDRALRLGQRVGGLMTSGMWKSLTQQDLLVESYRPVQEFRVSDHAGRPTPDYVSLLYKLFLEREADPAGMRHYSYVADTHGRANVASELSREAAHRGLFVAVVEG